MIYRITIISIPITGKSFADGGEPIPEGAQDNIHATKYQKRVGDIRNLEASNELFAKLVEEMHKRGMKVILDGVFNHCGSFNKWLDRERIYEQRPEYPKGAYVSADSPYRGFFHSTTAASLRGRIMAAMTDGGDMIRFRSLHMRIRRNLSNI